MEPDQSTGLTYEQLLTAFEKRNQQIENLQFDLLSSKTKKKELKNNVKDLNSNMKDLASAKIEEIGKLEELVVQKEMEKKKLNQNYKK